MDNLSIQDNLVDADVWDAVQAFFDRHGLVHHQIEGFNKYITHDIPAIVERNTPINVEVEGGRIVVVHFREVFVGQPHFKEYDNPAVLVYPNQCVDKTVTYEAPIYADIEIINPLGVSVVHKKYHFANTPVMVLSQVCNLLPLLADKKAMASLGEDTEDIGGYFITKGTRRILAGQERSNPNHTSVFTKTRKQKPSFTAYSEIRSNSLYSGTTTAVGLIAGKPDPICVTLPYNDGVSIPIGVMMYALGVKSNDELISHLLPAELRTTASIDLITKSIEYSYTIRSRREALKYIGWKMGKQPSMSDEEIVTILTEYNDVIKVPKNIDYLDVDCFTTLLAKVGDGEREELAKAAINGIIYNKSKSAEVEADRMLTRDFLPHLGTLAEKKKHYLGSMVRKLLTVINGTCQPEDRDHYANKRVITSGPLLAEQFTVAFRRMRNDLIKSIAKSMSQCNSCVLSIKAGSIGSSLIGAISENKWGVNNTSDDSEGIGQAVDQFNFMSKLASLRKFSTPVAKGGQVEGPHSLHCSHFGVVGAFETPESEKCGLVKFLGLLGYVSIGCDSNSIKELIRASVSSITSKHIGETVVSVDGDWIGYTKTPYVLVRYIRQLRRSGGINWEVSVVLNETLHEIYVCTSSGRMMRPLFIVEEGDLIYNVEHVDKLQSKAWTWHDLLTNGVVEMIDKAEEEELLIVFYPSDLTTLSTEQANEVTHCELHPFSLNSTGDSIIPFLNRNQAPRITYEAQQGKQAIGVPGMNFKGLMKGTHSYMNYPQKPLISTRIANMIGFNEQPSGVNAMVMILPWRGDDQEDSTVFNLDSIERGFMCITKMVNYEVIVKGARDEKGDLKERIEVPDPSTCNNFKGSTEHLGSDGVVIVGRVVHENDILIGRVVVNNTKNSIHSKELTNQSVVYDHPWPATITAIQKGTNGDGYEYIRVQTSQTRDMIEGDKCSSRHGQKGTCSARYRTHDLPFTRDGSVADIIISTMAIPSRIVAAGRVW